VAGEKYELYMGSSEERFNKGLVMLLDVVDLFTHEKGSFLKGHRHLIPKGKGGSSYFSVIQEDKINGSSIRFSSDNLEQWTRACKCMLADIQKVTVICKNKDAEDQINKFNEPGSMYKTIAASNVSQRKPANR